MIFGKKISGNKLIVLVAIIAILGTVAVTYGLYLNTMYQMQQRYGNVTFTATPTTSTGKIVISDTFWTIDGSHATTADVGDDMEAHAIVKASGGPINGDLTICVKKDIAMASDTVCKTKNVPLDLDKDQQKDCCVSFSPDDASEDSMRGYFVELKFNDRNVYTMSSDYPPRLEVTQPTQTTTSSTTQTPTQTIEPKPTPTGLDMSKDLIYETMQQGLAKMDLYLKNEVYSPLKDGTPRWMWEFSNDLGALELIGDEENIEKATLVVFIPSDDPQTVVEQLGFTIFFIDTTVPEWGDKKPSFPEWYADQLELEKEESSIQVDGKIVKLSVYKELGNCMLTVSRAD